MELNGNRPLINVEGRVYRLSKRDYMLFQEQKNKARSSAVFTNDWSDLLHWVEDHGRYVCRVETYNY